MAPIKFGAMAIVTLAMSAPVFAAEQRAGRQARQIDRDQSGTITRDEWTLRPERFDAADMNKDGVLSLDELAASRVRRARVRQRALGAKSAALDRRLARRAMRSRVRSVDLDRNGVISRNEWRRPLHVFDRLDLNRDGVLSGDELRRAPRKARPVR